MVSTYNVYYADICICLYRADKMDINGQMVFFSNKKESVGQLWMTKYHEIKKYNFINDKMVSISIFTLEPSGIVEKIEPVG